MPTFRVNPQLDDGQETSLLFYLNDVVVVDQTFDTDMHRAWQEVVEVNILRAQDNLLEVVVGGPAIAVSDIVMWYRMDI